MMDKKNKIIDIHRYAENDTELKIDKSIEDGISKFIDGSISEFKTGLQHSLKRYGIDAMIHVQVDYKIIDHEDH